MKGSQLELLVEGFYHAIDELDVKPTREECEKALHYALQSLETNVSWITPEKQTPMQQIVN